MRRFSLSFILFPLLGWAQAPPKALLWKVEGAGLGRPSYVVGTVHSRDARAYRQVPELLELIRGQDAVAGELDLTDMSATALAMARTMMLPAGTTLADLYGKRQLKRVREAVAGQLGPMAMLGERLKPFFLMSLLAESVMNEDSAMVLDQYLQVKAQAMGKEVAGVETLQEQMAAVDALPLQEQADMLYDFVRTGLQGQDMDRMMNAYAAQDLGLLAKLASEGSLPESFGARLLKDRNVVMAHRLDSLMQEGRTWLFALGAAHLPGDVGVIARLRQLGYTVEPVLPGTGEPARP